MSRPLMETKGHLRVFVVKDPSFCDISNKKSSSTEKQAALTEYCSAVENTISALPDDANRENLRLLDAVNAIIALTEAALKNPEMLSTTEKGARRLSLGIIKNVSKSETQENLERLAQKLKAVQSDLQASFSSRMSVSA